MCEYVDSWEAVDGVGAVDDPPFFGEAAVGKYGAKLVGGASAKLELRRGRTGLRGWVCRTIETRSGPVSRGEVDLPKAEGCRLLQQRDVYQAEPGDDRRYGFGYTCQGCVIVDEGQVGVRVACNGEHRRAGVTSDDIESTTSEVGGDVSEAAPHIDNDTCGVDFLYEGSNGVLFDR